MGVHIGVPLFGEPTIPALVFFFVEVEVVEGLFSSFLVLLPITITATSTLSTCVYVYSYYSFVVACPIAHIGMVATTAITSICVRLIMKWDAKRGSQATSSYLEILRRIKPTHNRATLNHKATWGVTSPWRFYIPALSGP